MLPNSINAYSDQPGAFAAVQRCRLAWRRWFPDRTRAFQAGDRVFRVQRTATGPQLIERIVEQQGIDRDEYLTRGPTGEIERSYWLPDAFNRNPGQALEAARAQADDGVRALRRERMERILLRPRGQLALG